MSCQQVEESFTLYVDDMLAPAARAACERHLTECPVCRAELAKVRSLTQQLRKIPRPSPPIHLSTTISNTISTEIAARKRSARIPADVAFARWLRPRVMPYAIGSFASVILFCAMFSALRLSLTTLRDWDLAARHADALTYSLLANEATDRGPDIYKPVSAEIYAAGREPFASFSPSLNPQGALAALTRSSSHTHSRADDMVVVADVFSNGSASLAGVVQPPRDRHMLDDLQSALRQDAPFVPASFDGRPGTLRVVFVVQKVNVQQGKF